MGACREGAVCHVRGGQCGGVSAGCLSERSFPGWQPRGLAASIMQGHVDRKQAARSHPPWYLTMNGPTPGTASLDNSSTLTVLPVETCTRSPRPGPLCGTHSRMGVVSVPSMIKPICEQLATPCSGLCRLPNACTDTFTAWPSWALRIHGHRAVPRGPPVWLEM